MGAKPSGVAGSRSELHEAGLGIRRQVLGDAYVDRSLAEATEFTRPLQDLIAEYCWGAVWGRENLDRRTRSLLNLGILTALNRPHELELHIRGAVNNGCSPDEIREALLQTAIYCGVPAALDAFRVAKSVLQPDAAEARNGNGVVSATDADVAAEIARQEDQLRDALMHLDGDWLLENWAPEAIYVHGSGRIEDRQGFVDRLRQGGRRYESIETEQLHFSAYGNVAILTGIARLDISTADDRHLIETLFTRVYVRRDDRWQLAINHSSPHEA